MMNPAEKKQGGTAEEWSKNNCWHSDTPHIGTVSLPLLAFAATFVITRVQLQSRSDLAFVDQKLYSQSSTANV